ncbi:MAG: copper chaperone PCu(A)C [Pseudomonadota bacterium]
MLNKSIRAFAAACCLLAASAANAAVSISDAYAEPSRGDVGVAFFTALSTENDSILSITSECCKAVELHTSDMTNGIMRMRKLDALELKAGTPAPVQRAQGVMHTMLIGLTAPLKKGDAVKLTFRFKHAPQQTVTLPVRDAAKDAHAHHAH